MSEQKRRVLLVTGLSGAGLSTTLKALEDLGYEAIDNLPLSLAETLLAEAGGRPLALGVDCRTRGFSAENVSALITRIRARAEIGFSILFIDCEDRILQQRFTETRRRHPLAADRPVSDGVARERQVLAPLRALADLCIDTTDMAVPDFRRLVAGHFRIDSVPGLKIFVTSFAFRQGIPREADMLFDVRFLDNPHWDPVLRPLTGLDQPVKDRIEKDPEWTPFFDNMLRLVKPLLPRWQQEGKAYLTIAIGCTGGKHRSVFTAEKLCEWLNREGWKAALSHRDLRQPANINANGKQEECA